MSESLYMMRHRPDVAICLESGAVYLVVNDSHELALWMPLSPIKDSLARTSIKRIIGPIPGAVSGGSGGAVGRHSVACLGRRLLL
jgi:hypothetical protein